MARLDKKKVLTNLGLLLLSLAICLLILEVVVRVIVAQQSAFVLCAYQEDPVMGWRMQPNISTIYVPFGEEYSNQVETNSRGERGKEVAISGNETLILGLGDSFGFGLGVEEEQTYLRLLEKSLREKGKDVRIVNAAVNGYNTEQELDMLEEYAEKFDVDVAIVGFFSANDVYGNIEDNFRYEIANGCLQGKPPESKGDVTPIEGFRGFLAANFKSYGFFAEKIRAVPVLREVLMGVGLMQGKRAPPHLQALQNPPDEFMQAAWSETEKQFARAQEIAERNGLTIVFLDIPSNFQVKDDLREQALNAYGVPVQEYELDYPEKKVMEFLQGKPNLVFVETLQEFRESTETLYYERDPHWTPAGHALAAEILERELIERGLV